MTVEVRVVALRGRRPAGQFAAQAQVSGRDSMARQVEARLKTRRSLPSSRLELDIATSINFKHCRAMWWHDNTRAYLRQLFYYHIYLPTPFSV